MTREELVQLIEQNLSAYRIAKLYGVSKQAIRYWLDKYDLKTNHPDWSAGDKPRKCNRCGENDQNQFTPSIKYRCRSCVAKHQNELNRKKKKQLVEAKGGACVLCGYNFCQAGLEFHHLNPRDKDPEWRKLKNRSFRRVLKELEKCVLVCGNCHSEIHAGYHANHPALAA